MDRQNATHETHACRRSDPGPAMFGFMVVALAEGLVVCEVPSNTFSHATKLINVSTATSSSAHSLQSFE